jgi:hypothetical protein
MEVCNEWIGYFRNNGDECWSFLPYRRLAMDVDAVTTSHNRLNINKIKFLTLLYNNYNNWMRDYNWGGIWWDFIMVNK